MGVVRQVEHVVKEFILLVPEPDSLVGNIIHRSGNGKKMLEKFQGNILVNRIGERQFQRDSHHIQAIHTHPTGAIALFEITARGQRSAAIKDADIVQPKKTSLKDVIAF